MGLSPILVERNLCGDTRGVQRWYLDAAVEQNARLALEIAQRGYVMESGQVSFSGPASELLHDPRVREAYLGEST